MGQRIRLVAFLRGVNVGGHTVKMDRLREAFEKLGLQDVATYIASGNVMFTSDGQQEEVLGAAIAAHLLQTFDFAIPVMLRSADELRRIVGDTPYDSPEDTTYVAFLSGEPAGDLVARLDAYGSTTDDFTLSGRELYWNCRTRMSESIFFGKLLEKEVGVPMTTRNMTTVRKIVARIERESAG